jgi:hypothetical protein
VIVAVAAVRMMEVAVNQVIDVIAVRERLVAAAESSAISLLCRHRLLLTQPTSIFRVPIRTLEAAFTPILK